ncbi:hypothetical protein EV2_014633 [Malus domestica]
MDMETCCFDSCTNDVLPQCFDPKDMYQQYKINLHKNIINVSGDFVARSMSKDGYHPEIFKRDNIDRLNNSALTATLYLYPGI